MVESEVQEHCSGSWEHGILAPLLTIPERWLFVADGLPAAAARQFPAEEDVSARDGGWLAAMRTLQAEGWEITGLQPLPLAPGSHQAFPAADLRAIFFTRRIPERLPAVRTMSLGKRSVAVGEDMHAIVVGYEPGTPLRVVWIDEADAEVVLTTVTTNAFGAASHPLSAPATPCGRYRVMTFDREGRAAPAVEVEIQPRVLLDPPCGPPGTLVTVGVTGFPAQAKVMLRWMVGTESVHPGADIQTDHVGSGVLSGIAAPASPTPPHGQPALIALGGPPQNIQSARAQFTVS